MFFECRKAVATQNILKPHAYFKKNKFASVCVCTYRKPHIL